MNLDPEYFSDLHEFERLRGWWVGHLFRAGMHSEGPVGGTLAISAAGGGLNAAGSPCVPPRAA
jgi:hypothetical protein